MQNCHKSEKLEALLGKLVKLVLHDGSVYIGFLGKDMYSERYRISSKHNGPMCFYKTHVRKIEEAW